MFNNRIKSRPVKNTVGLKSKRQTKRKNIEKIEQADDNKPPDHNSKSISTLKNDDMEQALSM
jgi:hypothetical protein